MQTVFKRIRYADLTARQKEIFQFQKIAAVLADYGFHCVRLGDEWQGVDFLAYHRDGIETLKIRLGSMLSMDRRDIGKNLWMAFPLAGGWCVIAHDELVEIVGRLTPWLTSPAWTEKGRYQSARVSEALLDALRPYWIIREAEAAARTAELFAEEPPQWGLRGDAYLWQAMREYFRDAALPADPEGLREAVALAFHELTQHPLAEHAKVYVKEYDRGGMSGGQISARFWIEVVIPLLIARQAKLIRIAEDGDAAAGSDEPGDSP